MQPAGKCVPYCILYHSSKIFKIQN
uniref:Uncharacterized protein n=1 Tax=Rhizophora mucronata TaxID=61149 RepID=A0A2P2N1N1_RHIMU